MQNLPSPIGASIAETEENHGPETPWSFSLPDLPDNEPAEETDAAGLSGELLEHARKTGCKVSEIEPLIQDRIIVSKSQINKSFRYAGRITASGLDYNAKLAAIRSAISKSRDRESALIRIELPNEELIVQPLEIVKAGPSSNVLQCRVLPEGTEINIPVSSIFQVTVLRWALK